MLGSLVTRLRLGDRKEAEEGIRGKGLPEGEGRIANQLPSCLSGGPIRSRLAHNVSRQGRFTSTFGRVGRRPGIKDSARAGSRHSGVRLEVSLGFLSFSGQNFVEYAGLVYGIGTGSFGNHGLCGAAVWDGMWKSILGRQGWYFGVL